MEIFEYTKRFFELNEVDLDYIPMDVKWHSEGDVLHYEKFVTDSQGGFVWDHNGHALRETCKTPLLVKWVDVA